MDGYANIADETESRRDVQGASHGPAESEVESRRCRASTPATASCAFSSLVYHVVHLYQLQGAPSTASAHCIVCCREPGLVSTRAPYPLMIHEVKCQKRVKTCITPQHHPVACFTSLCFAFVERAMRIRCAFLTQPPAPALRWHDATMPSSRSCVLFTSRYSRCNAYIARYSQGFSCLTTES